MSCKVVCALLAVTGLILCACGGGDDNEPQLSPECQQLKPVITSCFDAWCAGRSKPFCSCWTQGKELQLAPCGCIPWDWELECKLYRNFDCESAKTTLADVEKNCE
jgi:hypothetical protein